MVICICGRHLIEEVGDGYVLTPDQEKKWMRRRTDAMACPACGRKYGLEDLKGLVKAPTLQA